MMDGVIFRLITYSLVIRHLMLKIQVKSRWALFLFVLLDIASMFGGVQHLKRPGASQRLGPHHCHHGSICWVTAPRWGQKMQSNQAFQSVSPKLNAEHPVMLSGSSIIAEEASSSRTNQREWRHKDPPPPVSWCEHTFSSVLSQHLLRFSVSSDFNQNLVAEDTRRFAAEEKPEKSSLGWRTTTYSFRHYLNGRTFGFQVQAPLVRKPAEADLSSRRRRLDRLLSGLSSSLPLVGAVQEEGGITLETLFF